MPDENRVFDVSKPSKVSPSATSKPVIVGHHPLMNDPMVRNESTPAESTKIPVNDDLPTVGEALAAHQTVITPPTKDHADLGSPAVFSDPQDEPQLPQPVVSHPESVANGPFTEMDPGPAHPSPVPEMPEPEPRSEAHIEGLHFDPPKHKRGALKPILLGLVILIVAAYLAIDSGLVNAGIKMPFHVFKQKTQPASAPTVAQPPAAPALPDGFKEYKLAGTDIIFAAPLAWGDPTSTTDPGYSKRSTATQPDGTYAYLVNFSTNKDIQIAVTSNKFLPTTRTALYYDYLQWCNGTSDGLIYQSVLNFSTANKVDTPTTVTCNQGPVAGATKVDDSTIVQAQAKDTAGKVIGDIYTKNLSDPELVVFRVKDAVMTNGTDIKQLLDTVKVSAVQSSTSSTP